MKKRTRTNIPTPTTEEEEEAAALSSDSESELSEHLPDIGEFDDDKETVVLKRCKTSGNIVLSALVVSFVLFGVFSLMTFIATLTGSFVLPAKITVTDFKNYEMESNQTNITTLMNHTYEYFSPAYTGNSYVRYADFLNYLEGDEFEAGMYEGLMAWRIACWIASLSFYYGIGLLTLGAPVGMENLKLAFGKAPWSMAIPLILMPTLNSALTFYSYCVLQFKDNKSDELAFQISYLCRLNFICYIILGCYQYGKVTGLKTVRSRFEFTLCLIGPSMFASFLAAIAFPQYIMPAFAKADDFKRMVMAVTIPNVVFFMLFVAARLAVGRLETTHRNRVVEAEASCIILSFLSIFWSRILVSGNQPRSSLATSSLVRRMPLFYTAMSSAVIQYVSRITAGTRDRIIGALFRFGCVRCLGYTRVSQHDKKDKKKYESSSVVPSKRIPSSFESVAAADGEEEEEEEEETQEVKMNHLKSMQNVVVIDVISEYTIILWLPSVVAMVEVTSMDTSIQHAIWGFLLNVSVQLLPELLFGWLFIYTARMSFQSAKEAMHIFLPWILAVAVFLPMSTTLFAIPGIALNVLAG